MAESPDKQEYHEADSVKDIPFTEQEGRVLVDDIQNSLPEDFIREAGDK